jgi:integrase
VKNPRTARDPSTIVNRTVTPRRPRNADLREREYLTPKEVDRLQDAARKHSRYGHRDATAILIAYRHGLRASELCELTWNMIELDSGRIHVRRPKMASIARTRSPARRSGHCASCGGRTYKAATSLTQNAAAR